MKILKLSKGGTSFPGKIGLKIDSDILNVITKGYKIILITGTNGKTTTTSMITNILKKSGKNVITNATGANMLNGIISTFIENYKFRNKDERFGIIEIDEANLKLFTSKVSPNIIVVTNVFRDQLDRFGEIYTTLNYIIDGIKNCENAKLILNGDESLLGGLDLKNEVIYYGFQNFLNDENPTEINIDAGFCKVCSSPYKYNFVTYNHLGDFYCEECGYKRPELKYAVTNIMEITSDYSIVNINDNEVRINQPGIYNIYNGLSAYSVSKELEVDEKYIAQSLLNQESSFGRQEKVEIEGKDVKIVLVKNPAGYNQAIDTATLLKEQTDIGFLLNDNYADGQDVSWIWDVNFEKLKNINIDKICVGGIRKYDMALRLEVSEISPNKPEIIGEHKDLVDFIKTGTSKNVCIFTTYTAMLSLRKYLFKEGYIKKLW